MDCISIRGFPGYHQFFLGIPQFCNGVGYAFWIFGFKNVIRSIPAPNIPFFNSKFFRPRMLNNLRRNK